MDEKSKERVKQIAKSLKELHLATNMEEALDRAREIVESAKSSGKPIKSLLGDINEETSEEGKKARHIESASERTGKELSKEARKERKDSEHNIESAKKDKSSAKSAKENLDYDIRVHKLEKGDVEEATHEVDDIKCAVKDAGFIVKEAEKVQKRKKK